MYSPHLPYPPPHPGAQAFDPRSLPTPRPWLAHVFIVVAIGGIVALTAAIASFVVPHAGRAIVPLWTFGKWLLVVAFALELAWVHRAWSALPPWCRATATGRAVTPSEAVFYHFVPILNLGWVFTAHIGVCEATNAVLEAYGEDRASPRASPRLAFWALTLGSIPGIAVLALPLLLGRHMARCDAAQLRMHALLVAAPPPRPLAPPTEGPGRRSLIRWRWVGPATFLFCIIAPAVALSILAGRAVKKAKSEIARLEASAATAPARDGSPDAIVSAIASAVADCASQHPDEPLPELRDCPAAQAAMPHGRRHHEYELELDSAHAGSVRARSKGSNAVVSEVFVGCSAGRCQTATAAFAPAPPTPAWHESRGTVPGKYPSARAVAWVGTELRVLVPHGVMTVLSVSTSSTAGSASLEAYTKRSSDELVAMSADGRFAVRTTPRFVSVIDLVSGQEQSLSRAALGLESGERPSNVLFSLSADGSVVGAYAGVSSRFVGYDRVKQRRVGAPLVVGGRARISANGREAEVEGNPFVVRDLARGAVIARLPVGTIRSRTGKWAYAWRSSPAGMSVTVIDPSSGAPRGALQGTPTGHAEVTGLAECSPREPGGPTRFAILHGFDVTLHDIPSGARVGSASVHYKGLSRSIVACARGGDDVVVIVDGNLARVTPR